MDRLWTGQLDVAHRSIVFIDKLELTGQYSFFLLDFAVDFVVALEFEFH